MREPSLELWRQCREELAQEAEMDRLGQELRPRVGTPHKALVWLFPLRVPRLARGDSRPLGKARDFLAGQFDGADRGRRRRSPGGFFLLVFVLSLPFWLIGAVTEPRLLPGLPVSSLMFICPAIAAAILVYGVHGIAGVKALLIRAFDYERIGTKVWYAPVLLLMPGVMVLTYGLMRLAEAPLPPPEFPVLALPAMLLAFLVAALGEELGWSGYATDPLQDRWGAFRTSIFLGSVSAAWHVVPLVQAGRSAAWVGWWCLFTVAGRVLTVWVYNNAGKSVFAAALFHATSNSSWQLFPNFGSHWDPSFVAPIVVFAAVAVTFLWGPKTLARYRYGGFGGPPDEKQRGDRATA